MELYDADGKKIFLQEDETKTESKLKGKNIVFLGDSIHAYQQWDGVTVPYLIQSNTGAKCYNWCQGGMTMALTDVASYDPYSCVGMVNALTQKDFTSQETYAGDDHGTAQGNFTEQIAEMKEIGLDTADIVVIEFGTNDCIKLVDLDDSENELNTKTTAGALRYAIKTLLNYKSNLLIFVCNVQKMTGYADAEHQKPYDSSKQTQAINNVCEKLNVPIIDIYGNLLLNDYTKGLLLHDGLHRTHEGKVRQATLIQNVISNYL